ASSVKSDAHYRVLPGACRHGARSPFAVYAIADCGEPDTATQLRRRAMGPVALIDVVVGAGMRGRLVPVGDFATWGVAQAQIRYLRAGTRGARIGLGQAPFGVHHGHTVDGGAVVNEIFAGCRRGVRSGRISCAQRPMQSVLTVR